MSGLLAHNGLMLKPTQLAPVNDPSILAYLRFNGANNSKNIIDEVGNTWTLRGDGYITTTDSVFGGSSFFIPATSPTYNEVICVSRNFVFPSDFTIECWFRANMLSNTGIFSFSSGIDENPLRGVYLASGSFVYFVNWNNAIIGGTPSTTEFKHVALVRHNGIITLYINGSSVGSTSDNSVITINTLRLGDFDYPANRGNGYHDEFILTDNAKYTGNFTPPTTEVPYTTVPSTQQTYQHYRLLIDSNNGSPSYSGMTEWYTIEAKSNLRVIPLNISASSTINGSNIPSNVIDNNTNNGWLSATAAPGEWIRADYAYRTIIKSFGIMTSWNSPLSTPKDFQFQASNNGTDWVTLKTVTNQTGWTTSEIRYFDVY